MKRKLCLDVQSKVEQLENFGRAKIPPREKPIRDKDFITEECKFDKHPKRNYEEFAEKTKQDCINSFLSRNMDVDHEGYQEFLKIYDEENNYDGTIDRDALSDDPEIKVI